MNCSISLGGLPHQDVPGNFTAVGADLGRAFALEARLAGPVALRGLLHLDGLVAMGRFLLSDDPEDLVRALPLATFGSCYVASAAFLMTDGGARSSALGCWWTGRGDPEACFEAVRQLRHLGAVARIRHESITDWRLHALDDRDDIGIRGTDGRPLRAVPLAEWRALSGRDEIPPHAVVGPHRPRPPYWEQAGSIPCVMPERRDAIPPRAELGAILGIA